MTSWEFPTSDPIDRRVRRADGRIKVTAVSTQTATVTLAPHKLGGRGEKFLAASRVELDQGTLSVIAPDRHRLGRDGSLEAAVELPEGSSCRVDTASADVSCTGELSTLDVHTASGDVRAERGTGLARIASASVDVDGGDAAALTLETASRDVSAAPGDGH